jgi:hypothetical protein
MMDPVKHEGGKEEHDEEEEIAFLPDSRPRDAESDDGRERRRARKMWAYARIAVEVVTALAIVGLLLRPAAPKKTWQKVVPDCTLAS